MVDYVEKLKEHGIDLMKIIENTKNPAVQKARLRKKGDEDLVFEEWNENSIESFAHTVLNIVEHRNYKS